MKTFVKIFHRSWITFAIALSCVSSQSLAVPHSVRQDNIKFGKQTATNVTIEFDTADGASNKKLIIDGSTKNGSLNVNDMTFGDGAASDKQLIFDTGSGANNPRFRFNNATGKLELADDGTSFNAINDISANNSLTMENTSIATSVGSSALTISLTIADGTTDPSVGSPSRIAFRDPTITNGGFNIRSVTGALSTVISFGSTAGHTNNAKEFLYVYLLDNVGAVEIAWSSSFFDDGSIVTTTAEGGAGGADSATTIFSTTARTDVPIRFVKKLESTQVVVGTWDAAITEVSERSTHRYTLGSTQVFTSSDTWTRPQGVLAVKIQVIGGGGGGGGVQTTAAGERSSGGGGGGAGTAFKFITVGLGGTETITIGAGGSVSPGATGGTGGNSSFGSHATGNGGVGGGAGAAGSGTGGSTGGAGASATGGNPNIRGKNGMTGFSSTGGSITYGGLGGNSVLGHGGPAAIVGAAGSLAGTAGHPHGGGGGGAANGPSQTQTSGGIGTAGIIIVEEYY